MMARFILQRPRPGCDPPLVLSRSDVLRAFGPASAWHLALETAVRRQMASAPLDGVWQTHRKPPVQAADTSMGRRGTGHTPTAVHPRSGIPADAARGPWLARAGTIPHRDAS